MKTVKKSSSLFVFGMFAVVSNICSMDEPQPKKRTSSRTQRRRSLTIDESQPKRRTSSTPQRKRSWSQTAIDAIQKLVPIREVSNKESFNKLPKNKKATIISLITTNVNTESLDIAAHTINSLTQVNHELNQLINNPDYCLKVIKNLAQRFDCSDFVACAALQTQAAKQRLKIQKQFYDICISQQHPMEEFNILFAQADVTFTYDYLGEEFSPIIDQSMPPLQLTIIKAPRTKPAFFEKFIAKPEIINLPTSTGMTPLMAAIHMTNMPYILALLHIRNIAVNQKDLKGNTALMLAIKQRDPIPAIIEAILQAGADPHIANNDGLTPLTAAERTRNKRIIDSIKNANNI
ncbi:MAG TPA: ankyrin repeat domain-containing protein [Candidatus Babeliales bacterium]|nr:ankyrin repeat domain-containing protein [Candidatus Babeliales bacterium]